MKEVQLTKGLVAIVDDEDFAVISSYAWHPVPQHGGKWKASRRARHNEPEPSTVYMARQICGARTGETVDHINGDTLDNRRSNLRICSHAQNCKNRPRKQNGKVPYKGVDRSNVNGKPWLARFNGKRIGCFEDVEIAAMAYNVASYSADPEFAFLNEVRMG